MSQAMVDSVWAASIVFCRVGGCAFFTPALSSGRIPMQIRLLVSLGIALALTPMLHEQVLSSTRLVAAGARPALIINETIIGASIGTMARFFLLALQFAATAIGNMIGLAGIPGIPMEEAEVGSPLTSFASSAAVLVIFMSGLHIEMLRGMVQSYHVIPVNAFAHSDVLLADLTKVLSETSILALRLASPFVVYGVVVNIMVGLINRFTPHISIYHATTGIVMIGGFLLLYFLWSDIILLFIESYRSWLLKGGF